MIFPKPFGKDWTQILDSKLFLEYGWGLKQASINAF
jgi:hypothetical protein